MSSDIELCEAIKQTSVNKVARLVLELSESSTLAAKPARRLLGGTGCGGLFRGRHLLAPQVARAPAEPEPEAPVCEATKAAAPEAPQGDIALAPLIARCKELRQQLREQRKLVRESSGEDRPQNKEKAVAIRTQLVAARQEVLACKKATQPTRKPQQKQSPEHAALIARWKQLREELCQQRKLVTTAASGEDRTKQKVCIIACLFVSRVLTQLAGEGDGYSRANGCPASRVRCSAHRQ